MKRWRRAVLATLLLLSGFVATAGLWLRVQQRQYALDRRLIDALVKHDDEQAIYLVNNGANPNTPYIPTPVPSLSALVKQLLHPTSSVNISPTAFMLACGHVKWSHDGSIPSVPIHRPGDTQLMHVMLSHGADVNTTDEHGLTPLMYTIRADDRPDKVRLLLLHGANPNAQDKGGNTPLMSAVVTEGIPSRSPDTALLLLEHGANVNARDTNGSTPLMLACMYNPAPDIIELLLEHRASVNAQNMDGMTPLFCAVMDAGNKTTAGDEWTTAIRQLLAHGADPNLATHSGRTPLQIARKQKSFNIIAVLRQGGARK